MRTYAAERQMAVGRVTDGKMISDGGCRGWNYKFLARHLDLAVPIGGDKDLAQDDGAVGAVGASAAKSPPAFFLRRRVFLVVELQDIKRGGSNRRFVKTMLSTQKSEPLEGSASLTPRFVYDTENAGRSARSSTSSTTSSSSSSSSQLVSWRSGAAAFTPDRKRLDAFFSDFQSKTANRCWLESQSRPSYSPSPLVAQVAWMYQLRWRRACRPSLSVISAAFIALGRSWRRRQTVTTDESRRSAAVDRADANGHR
ncbi:hypothetical protein EYF80_020842 [Liparis tanakae]|uniref:Uncharacterized protein n=1 Tax=Liparis tanakae TaxID=230148 RepID=A0A4Z2HTV1_9TELE|nr:hypothetical protein EYF80_020842 [Liparis tanakae]